MTKKNKVRNSGNTKLKAVGEVFTTSDYNRFILSPLNREVCPKHVRKLKKLIQANGFSNAYHIIVHDRDVNGKKFPGGKLMIFDGQHRKRVAEEMGIPVPYMINNEWKHGSDTEFIDKNNSQKTWSLEDFRHHWDADGNRDYQIVGKFMKQHPKLSLSICASLLSGKEGGDAYGVAFKEGRFEVASVKNANNVAKIVTEIRKMLPLHSTNIFIKAIQKMYLTEGFDSKHLLKKMQAHGSTLIKWSTREEYVKGLEDVYNWHTPAKNKIKFYRV